MLGQEDGKVGRFSRGVDISRREQDRVSFLSFIIFSLRGVIGWYHKKQQKLTGRKRQFPVTA